MRVRVHSSRDPSPGPGSHIVDTQAVVCAHQRNACGWQHATAHRRVHFMLSPRMRAECVATRLRPSDNCALYKRAHIFLHIIERLTHRRKEKPDLSISCVSVYKKRSTFNIMLQRYGECVRACLHTVLVFYYFVIVLNMLRQHTHSLSTLG